MLFRSDRVRGSIPPGLAERLDRAIAGARLSLGKIERIVATHATFVVVEKLPGEPAELARENDPRV